MEHKILRMNNEQQAQAKETRRKNLLLRLSHTYQLLDHYGKQKSVRRTRNATLENMQEHTMLRL